MSLDDTIHPQLRPDFEIIPFDASVVLRSPDTGVRLQIEGMSAAELAAFLRALDGSRNVGELLNDQPARAALSELVTGLMAREIVRTTVLPPSLPVGARFFAHFTDDPAACWRRLQASRVVVCGGPRLGARVREGLAAAGVTHVVPLALADVKARVGQLRANTDLVIAALDGPFDDALSSLNDAAQAGGCPWLLVRVFGVRGFVGPLFVPGEGPCLACFMVREEASWADPEVTRRYQRRLASNASSLGEYGWLPAFDAIAAQHAVIEATRFLAGFTPPMLLGGVLRLDLLSGETHRHRVLRQPRCSKCAPVVDRPALDPLLEACRG